MLKSKLRKYHTKRFNLQNLRRSHHKKGFFDAGDKKDDTAGSNGDGGDDDIDRGEAYSRGIGYGWRGPKEGNAGESAT